MIDLILRELMDRYGHLSLDELKARLEEQGLGDLVDLTEQLIESDPGLVQELIQHSLPDPSAGGDTGVIPQAPEVEVTPVEPGDRIHFDGRACLESCTGNCCRGKNYLMISIADIYRMILSPAAQLLVVRSTNDLFERNPPLVRLFFNKEYGLYLPYIQYLPVGAAASTLPEDAPGSVCPFLFPIEEVCSLHRIPVPRWAGKEARGCILMRDKPRVCRLSPVGQLAGMVTGRVSYAYVIPAIDCPACETEVTVELEEHLEDAELPGEREQDEHFHRVLMNQQKKALGRAERRRYQDILRQAYNIDGLLLRHGIALQHRPDLHRLIEICSMAARGEFEPFDRLLEELLQRGEGQT